MNPRTAILLVAAAFSLDLTGCNSLRGFPALPATSSASAPTPGYQLGPGAILDYNSAKDLDSKLLIRNDIIDARKHRRRALHEAIGVR